MDNAEELLRNAEKLIDNLNTSITSYQFGKYHGKDCIACYDQKGELLYFDDGIECHVPSINDNLEYIKLVNVVIFVFDLSSKDSFLDMKNYYDTTNSLLLEIFLKSKKYCHTTIP